MLFRRGWLALVAVCTAGGMVAQTAPPPAPPIQATASVWPARESDLPEDPALVQGALPNGLRYLILPNPEPKDKISLRLLVRAGSLHENDDERGLAHFVEHMAFRGTRAFPAGSMTAALQRLGIGLGPDSTAFTSFDHTIYHLELPDAGEATLREGLRAFREYADAVTFETKLIDQERGVILNEMATRDTPDARSFDANFLFLWPGSREVQRKVIGLPAQLRTFTRAQFVAFYDAWYRPERMAVVVVGTVEPAVAQRLVAENFESLQARGPARPEPSAPAAADAARPNVGVFTDAGFVGIGLSLERPAFAPPEPNNAARRERNLHEALAFAMLRNRLQKIAEHPHASFVSPDVSLVRPRPSWRLASISVSGRIDDWRKLAGDLEREHRRAFQFGFTARELAEARGALATMYEQMERSASTRHSAGLAQDLVAMLLHGGTFATPATIRREVDAGLAAATLAKCHEAFRAIWTQSAPSVFVSANPVFNITRHEIAEALNASRKTTVAAPVDAALAAFAYTDFGPPGRLERDEHLADLDVRLSRFANGVCLNFKRTPFQADTVDLRVRVGDGKLSQFGSQPGVDLLADTAFLSGGVGRHSTQELREILSSHALNLSFQVQSDACGFFVRCAPRELDLALRVIAAYLVDAKFRPDGLRQAQAETNTMYASLIASPSGAIAQYALRELLTDDRRFGLPLFNELGERTLEEVEAWLQPQLKEGPVELSIVGDIDWETASAAVARTLGALPPRAAVTERTSHLPVRFASPLPRRGERSYTVEGTFQQAALAWYWPVPVVAGIREERRCHLLSLVLADRLRLKLRDEIGATYSPSMNFVTTDGFPNLNYFMFYAEIDPTKRAQAVAIVDREVADLGGKGPTADEFERARQVYLRGTTDHLRNNGYWGGTVLSDAQQRPTRIASARDRAADNAAITREEITALAGRHLDPARAFRFASLPDRANMRRAKGGK